jgi:hypothetical protein
VIQSLNGCRSQEGSVHTHMTERTPATQIDCYLFCQITFNIQLVLRTHHNCFFAAAQFLIRSHFYLLTFCILRTRYCTIFITSNGSQFCCHTIPARCDFAATPLTRSLFAIALRHPSNEQPVLLPHHFQRGVISAITPLHPSNEQLYLVTHGS